MNEVAAKVAEVATKAQEVTSKVEKYNPDKRIEPIEKTFNTETTDRFDPDKRINSKDGGSERITSIENTDKLEQAVDKYVKDVKHFSECPETLRDFKINTSELRSVSVEEQGTLRREFAGKKDALIKEWEAINGQDWPRYTKDVVDSNGTVIRKAGDRLDAHHKVPLSMGGENTASNITPMRADVHYDHRGVHAKESAYSEMRSIVKEMA